ncbi:MAG TPA: hypothetical protein PLM75_12755, partial [bacterium]|nr:hypothetical protein [bacterium]
YKILMYEIWTAHQPNVIIDISDVMQEKIKLLKIYKSQLINKDYEYIIRGLNSYRTAYLKNQNGFAESFVLLHNVSEFLYLFETLTKK